MNNHESVLDVMVKYKDSRKFTFNELKRHLGASHGSLDGYIKGELRRLLDMGTIGEIPNPILGNLYYVSFSKQDPTRKLAIRIVCAEGKTQSLRTMDSAEEAPDIFRRYKARLASVQQLNPGITDEWLSGLTYSVED